MPLKWWYVSSRDITKTPPQKKWRNFAKNNVFQSDFVPMFQRVLAVTFREAIKKHLIVRKKIPLLQPQSSQLGSRKNFRIFCTQLGRFWKTSPLCSFGQSLFLGSTPTFGRWNYLFLSVLGWRFGAIPLTLLLLCFFVLKPSQLIFEKSAKNPENCKTKKTPSFSSSIGWFPEFFFPRKKYVRIILSSIGNVTGFFL